MYVIDVIPLSRTAPGILSYRSKDAQAPGSIVQIMLRKKQTQGIVITCVPVSEAKEMLKHARFLLSKSIPSAAGKLPEAVLQAVQEIAAYHATSIGSVLSAVFSEYAKLELPLPTIPYVSGDGYVRETLELPILKRVAIYQKKIEEAVLVGAAVLLVTPSIAELLFWKETFAKYKPLIISGSLTGAARTKALTAASSHEGLIITTPSFSFVPVEKLTAVYIDRVSAGTYTLPQRPYLGMVHALESLAKARKIPCVLGDYPLPLEYRTSPEAPLQRSAASNIVSIDARRPKDSPAAEALWRVFPESVIEEITNALLYDVRVLVLATRKGYAPAVICRDCGQAQTDERGVPLTFSIANGKRVFISSDGVSILSTKRTCSRCESWNLLPLGIGIERVEEELQVAFPNATIITASADKLSTPRKVRALLEEAKKPRTILIGTEALLPWLYAYGEREYLGVIASADSLLALPFWRARERFVRLSYFLAGLCKEVMLVTRHPEDAAVEALTRPKAALFWEEETQLRKALGYPPFGAILSLSIEDSIARVERTAAQICEALITHTPTLLPSRTTGQNTKVSIILMFPDGAWPDITLMTYLRSLPPTVRVRVDPESFW